MTQHAHTVLINGAQGKMGQICQQAIADDKKLSCIACCDHQDDLAQQIQQHHPDIVVDLTTPESVFDNTMCIIEHNARPVIGTSGLSELQIEGLLHICEERKMGGLIIPNFSLSAVLMMRYARDAARYFDHIEITELHHITKKDAPSGTALHTAHSMISNNPKLSLHTDPVDKQHGILIHSQRTPQHHAMQDVACHAAFESLNIKAHCFDRQAYMKGIQLACKAVMQQQHMSVGLESILQKIA